jgi:hypothetical protein
LDDRDQLSEQIEGRIVNIFYLFSQAENYVKEIIAGRMILKRKQSSTFVLHPVTNLYRHPQGPQAHVPYSSNHHAQVRQKSVNAR